MGLSLSHSCSQDQLPHTSINGVSSIVLSRKGTGPTFPSSISSERQGQLSHLLQE